MRRLSCLLLLCAAVLGACASSDDARCERIAEHQLDLILAALPPPMRKHAGADIAKHRGDLQRKCEASPPSASVATCKIAARDLAAFSRCDDASSP